MPKGSFVERITKQSKREDGKSESVASTKRVATEDSGDCAPVVLCVPLCYTSMLEAVQSLLSDGDLPDRAAILTTPC